MPFYRYIHDINNSVSQNKEASFKQARKVQACEVRPLFKISSSVTPSNIEEEMFLVDIELQNVSSSAIQVTQISTISPSWMCTPSANAKLWVVLCLGTSKC